MNEVEIKKITKDKHLSDDRQSVSAIIILILPPMRRSVNSQFIYSLDTVRYSQALLIRNYSNMLCIKVWAKYSNRTGVKRNVS